MGSSYPRKIDDILAVQDEIVAQILAQLRLHLSPQEQERVTKRYTEHPDAYRLYVQGRRNALTFTKEGFDKSVQQFQQALQIDPEYALAFSGMAEAYLTAADLFIPNREAGPKAKDFAIEALVWDEDLSEAHCALGRVLFEYNWSRLSGEQEFKKAMELDPNSGCANDIYGAELASVGRFDEAFQALERVLQLDPKSVFRHYNRGQAFYYSGKYDLAIEELQKTNQLDPSYWFAHLFLGLTYQQMKMYDRALQEFERLPLGFQDAPVFQALGYAMLGRKTEASKIIEQLKKSSPMTVTSWALANYYVGIGEKDAAFAWIDKAVDDRFIVLATVKVDPVFASLRSDARYMELLRTIHLEQ